jgi:hypothetical protein
MWLVGVASGLLVVPAPAAQAGAAALVGVLRDPSQLPIAGATVSAMGAATNVARATTSGDAGTFSIGGLPPGTYRVTITSPGFRTLTFDPVRLATGETVRVDATLELDVVGASVEVNAAAPTLRVDSPGLGHVVDSRRVTELPLDGRSFVPLVALAPGVALPPGSPLPRINGGRPRTNEYLFDGISVLQPEPGQVAFLPIVDAIHDFRIESNSPAAEFGRFNGGVVNLTTRAGTNELRGSLFEFARHERLNARNFFAPPTQAGPHKPLFRRNQYGLVAGGPIARDRTFFFVDYQGARQRIGRVLISTVPTELQRRGIFTEPVNGRTPTIYDPATTTPSGDGYTRTPFSGNALPAERMDPAAVALLDYYPLPTSAGTSNNYHRIGTETTDQDQADLRIDRQLSGAARAFARISFFQENLAPVTPLPGGSGNIAAGAIGDTRTRALAVATNHQLVVGHHALHDLRVGYTRRAVRRRGVPLPTFVIDGLQQIGPPNNARSDFRTDVTQIVDTIAWNSGRHTWKAGFDYRWSRLDIFQPPSPLGTYRFSTLFTDLPGSANTGSSLASFLLGQVQTFAIDLQDKPLRPRAHVQEYFIQDDWKPTPHLTINAGLRYTLNFPSTDADDQAAVFNLETRQLEFLGRDGHPRSARELQKTNFGPRLSVSSRVAASTIVRAGYGLVWIEQAGITTPFTTPHFPFMQSVGQRTLDNVTPAFALSSGPSIAPPPRTPDAGLGQGVFTVDRDLGSGYVQQWHAGAQYLLRPSISLDVAYVGSTITRVGIPDSNINQLTVDQLARGGELLQRVANPFFGRIPRSSSLGDSTIPLAQLLKPYPEFTTVSFYRNNVGTTSYHGLEVKMEQRAIQGVSYHVSYTRSRLVDDASSVFDAAILTGPIANAPVADSFNRKGERDVSTGDIPHVLSASLVWDVPFGRDRSRTLDGLLGAVLNDWSITSVLTLQSGTPVAVTQATNFNAFAGFGIQRPNISRDPALPAAQRTPSHWFNTAAFTPAPRFTLGNSSRNPVRGPSYRNLDLAMIRRVTIVGHRTLELRGEAFNVTNTPALGVPNGVLGTPGFGSITSAGDPRVIQLAVKLAF